jgi:hypothetical protein
MPASGSILDSTIISMRPVDIPQTTARSSIGITTTIKTLQDDREIFKVYFSINLYKIYLFILGIT